MGAFYRIDERGHIGHDRQADKLDSFRVLFVVVVLTDCEIKAGKKKKREQNTAKRKIEIKQESQKKEVRKKILENKL